MCRKISLNQRWNCLLGTAPKLVHVREKFGDFGLCMKVGLKGIVCICSVRTKAVQRLGVREKAEAMARAHAINISVMLLILS